MMMAMAIASGVQILDKAVQGVKSVIKKNNIAFLPLMAIGNESPKEF